MRKNNPVNPRNIQSSNIYLWIIILSVLSLIFTVIIMVQKTGNVEVLNTVCDAINTSQCRTVQQSTYASIFGFPNTVFGLIGFPLLAIFAALAWKHKKSRFIEWCEYLVILGCLIAAAFSLTFLYLQIFVIHAYCVYCVFVDILALIMLWLAILLMRK